jgi:hypothetical protein
MSRPYQNSVPAPPARALSVLHQLGERKPVQVGVSYTEEHFTPAELAGRWKLSADVIRVLFEKEPGVLVIGDQVSSRSKRRYRTMRIPGTVAERVHRRLSKV